MAEGGDGGDSTSGGGSGGGETAAVTGSTPRARPLVMPDTFSGDGKFDDWKEHFENVAAVNSWTDDEKLLWLKVRLTGKAQKAFKRLGDADRADYKKAMEALLERFEPASKRELYVAEFQVRRKKKNESWADFADDLMSLADKAYADLQEEARERLALNAYLEQIDDTQISFSVKQKRPRTLDEAVSATLEMESYKGVKAKSSVSHVEADPEQDDSTIAAVQKKSDSMAEMVQMMQGVVSRLEKLEASEIRKSSRATTQLPQAESKRRIVCWRCYKRGHIARNCTERFSARPGN